MIFGITSFPTKCHQKILLVCSEDKFSTGGARQRGYRLALAKRGLPVDATLIRAGEPTAEHGRKAVTDLPSNVTAIVVAGTMLTEGAVEVIANRALSVPHDLSFVGFGIENWHKWWCGGMTRIVPPVELLAATSVQHLLSQIGQIDQANVAQVMHVIGEVEGRYGRVQSFGHDEVGELYLTTDGGHVLHIGTVP